MNSGVDRKEIGGKYKGRMGQEDAGVKGRNRLGGREGEEELRI